MNTHKSAGTIVMVASIVIILLSFIFSTSWNSEIGVIPNIIYVMRLQLLETSERYANSFYFDIPVKYIIALCITTFAAGFLIYKGIFSNFKSTQQDRK